jgi:dTDP-4-dehydrorhamnose reductase
VGLRTYAGLGFDSPKGIRVRLPAASLSHQTRILVTGGNGILAQALRPFFPYADYCGRETCNVESPGHVRNAFNELKPELVIHCAAQTSHNAEPFSYVQSNIQGTVNVAAQAKKWGARLIYPSTDYLGARHECDRVYPVNQYAASKYGGECVVGALGNALVVRGSWYSRYELTHAATDAYTSKINVDRAAYFVATLATSSLTGTINIGGQRRSYYEIALEQNERVIPVSRTAIHCGYPLPADSSLDTSRLRSWLAA